MGSIYQPYCHSCNYNFQKILIGAGMHGPEHNYGPVACYQCNRLSQKNLNVEHLTCSRCRKEIAPLNGFGMDEEPKENQKHNCPKCGEKTLELMDVGMWD